MHECVPLCPEQEDFGFSELMATSVYSCSSAAVAGQLEKKGDKSTSINSAKETAMCMAVVSKYIDLALFAIYVGYDKYRVYMGLDHGSTCPWLPCIYRLPAHRQISEARKQVHTQKYYINLTIFLY